MVLVKIMGKANTEVEKSCKQDGRWKPGQSGNPAGRMPFEDDGLEVARRLASAPDGSDIGVRKSCPMYRIAQRRIKMAEKAKNHRVIDDLWTTIYRRPATHTEVTLVDDTEDQVASILDHGFTRRTKPEAG